MTKKKVTRPKHQKDVGDTSEEELKTPYQGKVCPHVQRAVNFARVRKALKLGNFNTCHGGCSSEEEVWLCLQCGHAGCGRDSDERHALQHFRTLHSDCHSLVLGPAYVWCYDCDDEVQLQCSNILRQCVEFVTKTRLSSSNKLHNKASEKKPEQLSLIQCVLKEQSVVAKVEELKKESKKEAKGKKEGPTTVKGLRNLGNTCFFNAVMQSLSQTQLLLGEVEASCVVGAQWTVPKLTLEDDLVMEDTKADPLRVELPRECQLLNSFLKFLRQMTSPPQNKGEVVNPTDLFNEIQKKSPQFQHYHQQDSHELLRQFLDHLRQEEVKRQKRAILKNFKIGNANQEISEYVRKLIKGYGSYASHTLVEKVFGGLLISTVLCEECKTSSQIFEPFMDLSLPLFEEKQQDQLCPLLDGGKDTKASKKLSRVDLDENEFILSKPKQDSGKPSKHLEKKQKMMMKKQKKAQRKKSFTDLNKKGTEVGLGDCPDVDQEAEDCPSGNEDIEENRLEEVLEESNPDSVIEVLEESNQDSVIEVLEESNQDSVNEVLENSNQQNSKNKVLEESNQDSVNEVLEESNQQQDSVEDASSKLEGVDIIADAAEDTSPVVTVPSAESPPEGADVPNLEEAEPMVSLESIIDEEETQDCNGEEGGDELSEHMQALSMQVRGVRIRRDSERATLSEDNKEDDEEGEWDGQGFSEAQTKEWVVKSLRPLQPRPQLPAQECSVRSCLSHFTRPELLAGANKFRCDHCTELKRTRSGDNKAVAYSNASKQLLVFSPPAVLTLHLKRFQQVGMSLRKVNRFVEFPIQLDLAPYCSSACLVLPHMSSVTTSVLYSLYAVVEHSGRLTSGHYTAYVRLPQAPRRASFLNAIPQCYGDLAQLLQRLPPPTTPREEEETEGEGGGGHWFYVSDTMVREASEAQVLRCQAYLLFYERIK